MARRCLQLSTWLASAVPTDPTRTAPGPGQVWSCLHLQNLDSVPVGVFDEAQP